MKFNTVKCEVSEVRTDSGICFGIARTRKGETFLIDGRTPPGPGMCSNAFGALSNAAFIMMCTDKMPGEKDGSVRITCPHGMVTYTLSRSGTPKAEAFDRKGCD